MKKNGAAFVDIVKGAFRFTSGRIREFSDKRIEVRTGSADICGRGQRLLGRARDDAYGFSPVWGRIEVRNGAGMVLMHKKRLGSTIANPGAAPDMPERWNKHQVNKAVATVAFK